MPNDTIPLPEPAKPLPMEKKIWYSAGQLHAHAAAVSADKDEEIAQLRQYLDAAQRRGEELRAQVAALEVEVREISGGAGVYMSLLMDCIAVLHTIDPDDSDEAEKLRDLLDAIDRALEPTRHKGALL